MTALPTPAVAEELAARIAKLDAASLPPAVREKCRDLLLDVIGLCVTARGTEYVAAALGGMVSSFDLANTVPEWALCYRFDIVLRGRNQTPMEH